MDKLEKLKDIGDVLFNAVLEKFAENFPELIYSDPEIAEDCFEAVAVVTSAVVEAIDFRKQIQKEVSDEMDMAEDNWEKNRENKLNKLAQQNKLKQSKEGYVRVPVFIDGKGMILEQLEENFPEILQNADPSTWDNLHNALENMELLIDIDPKSGDYVPVKFKDFANEEEITLK